MTDGLWLVLFPASVAAIGSGFLAWLRPEWSIGRTALIAALPVPVIGALGCAAIFITAAMTPEEKCGVDACGMAMMFSTILLGYALAAAGVGAVLGIIIKRAAARR